MIDKQAVLDAVSRLPESASWDDLTDALVRVAADHTTAAEFARLYRESMTAADLMEFLDPKPEVSLSSMIAELRTRNTLRSSP